MTKFAFSGIFAVVRMILPPENASPEPAKGRPVLYHFDGAQLPPEGYRWICAVIHPTQKRAKLFHTRRKLSHAVSNLKKSPLLANWFSQGGEKFTIRKMAEPADVPDLITQETLVAERRLHEEGMIIEDGLRSTLEWIKREVENGNEKELRKIPAFRGYVELAHMQRLVREMDDRLTKLEFRVMLLEQE